MIRIVEVGPRDGLQNEKVFVPTEAKVGFVNALSHTGTTEIEVSAFVSPKWVPQLKDAAEVFSAIDRVDGISYSALVPNLIGLERAVGLNVDKLAVFTAASDSFNRKNINTDIEGSFERLAPVIKEAGRLGIPIRGYVSTSFWCPYEGFIEPKVVVPVVSRLLDMGVVDVSIGDTIGKASPDEVRRLLEVLLVDCPISKLSMHFHDTYGRACENVLASYELGIETYDSCTGGIGGCPYAPGAAGNVATSVVVETLRKAGAEVSLDLTKIAEARKKILSHLGGKRQFAGSESTTEI